MRAGTLLSVLMLSASVASAQTPPPLQHHHETGQPPQKLGQVSFATSCDPKLGPDFNRAVALLHSFWFGASAAAFTAIAEKDPSCGMAWWGVAMSRWGNPFAPARPPAALKEGGTAIAKAVAAGAKTDRERGLIQAAATLFADFETVDQRTRTVNYERAMERVAGQNPGDREIAAFYALSVNQTALPSDKTYAQQLKAAAILEPIFKALPDHPGAAHYLIHAYDHPALAERALPAARNYAKIAPDAPHALHMPSHTFTRVGYWQDSIDTNRASAEAARKANSAAEILHALDYQVYAYLQTAQDHAAHEVMGELRRDRGRSEYRRAGTARSAYYAEASIPARYALERASGKRPPRSTGGRRRSPTSTRSRHFARAVGAARSGNVAAAKADAQKLAALHAALVEKKDEYWAQQVAIQQKAAGGWIAFAEQRKDEALLSLQEAARMEDGTDKSAVSPGPLAPARELLGEMLLELKRPKEALTELEAVMKKEPNRFRTLYLGARAASAAGDQAKAKKYYASLVKMCAAGDGDRPELVEARKNGKS